LTLNLPSPLTSSLPAYLSPAPATVDSEKRAFAATIGLRDDAQHEHRERSGG